MKKFSFPPPRKTAAGLIEHPVNDDLNNTGIYFICQLYTITIASLTCVVLFAMDDVPTSLKVYF